MQRLIIASGNAGKLSEFSAMLAPMGIEIVGQKVLGIGDADEPHVTFVENALAKARHASRLGGTAALADDSGLCVDALDGLPGVRSARYAGAGEADDRATRDRANNAKLVAALAGHRDRRAAFVCCLALVCHPDDPEPIVAMGRWSGRIVDEARGDGGFGYDSHFFVPEVSMTAAQLDPATKNRISHRAIALRRLVEALRLRERGDVRVTPS